MSRRFLKVVNFCGRKTFSLKDNHAGKIDLDNDTNFSFQTFTFEKVQFTNMVLVIF